MMAPVGAVQQIWQKTGWKNEDVDLYELNEAFSVQALGVMRELKLNPDDPDAQYQLGKVLLEQDKAREALPHLQAAAKLNPKSYDNP